MAGRRWPYMVRRLLFLYAVVELAVFIGLGLTIGFGWTLLVLLCTVILGFVLLAPLGGWQLGRQLLRVRSGAVEPGSALSDGAIATVATGLVLVPGLVTTAVGLFLLVPPLRSAVRPGLTAIAARGLLRSVPLSSAAAAGVVNGDFIDGEVIDVRDVEPPMLPPEPLARPASSG